MELPANALVMLMGAAASGKSSWARRHFADTEVVSSDRCRALVSDSESEQRANAQAFAVFYEILRGRAALGRLSVADSTAVQPWARERLRRIADRFSVPLHVVVFCVEPEVLLRRNAQRERRVPEEVVLRHAAALDALLASGTLEREGYDAVHRVTGTEPVHRVGSAARTQRTGQPPCDLEPPGG